MATVRRLTLVFLTASLLKSSTAQPDQKDLRDPHTLIFDDIVTSAMFEIRLVGFEA